MAFSLSGGPGLSASNRTSAPFAILVGGGSNVLGTSTGAPWCAFPGNFTYWTMKTGSLVNTGAWPTNPGIAMSMIDELRVLGHSGAITLVEWGIAGTSYSSWQGAAGNAIDAIAGCATAGIRPGVVVEYLGSVDAKTPALAAAIQANVQTTWDRYRTAWGGAVGIVQGGCHIPESGVDSDLDLTDTGMYTVTRAHKTALATYVNMRTMPIQGGGSDHITGQLPAAGITATSNWSVQPANATPGGCDIAGRMLARAMHNSGIVP